MMRGAITILRKGGNAKIAKRHYYPQAVSKLSRNRKALVIERTGSSVIELVQGYDPQPAERLRYTLPIA